ncbi:MAG: hypothetical protein WCO60_16075 [Verrucomicrobiota bacterium]
MKIFLYPYSRNFEALIVPVITALGLEIEASCSLKYIRNNLFKPHVATLLLVSAEIGQDASVKLCDELVDSGNTGSTSIIILGTDNTVESIAGAFASGAEDYICVPCASAVLRARIGAAVRRLRHFEHQLTRTPSISPQIESSDGRVLRGNQTAPKLSVSASEKDLLSARISGNSLSESFLSISTLRNIKSITMNGLCSMDINGLREVDHIRFKEGDVLCGTWNVLLLPDRNLWLDIVIETNQDSVDYLYNLLTPQKSDSARDTSTALMQVMLILKETIQNSFKDAGDHVIVPDFPKRLPAGKLKNIIGFVVDRVRVAVESNQFQMCISYYASERRSMFKAIEQIAVESISDELITLSGSDHQLVHRGVSLNKLRLKSLQRHFANASADFGVRVFEASGIASAIHNDHAIN